MTKLLFVLALLISSASLVSSTPCLAAETGDAPNTPESGGGAPKPDSYENFLRRTGTLGPSKIDFRTQAALNLPEGFAFIPEKPAREIMEKLGNEETQNFVGLIVPSTQDNWFISVEYVASGHISDDDAKNWDAGELLNNIKRNTEEGNKRNAERGIPALDIVGWVEKPHYDANTHRLVWSIEARSRGTREDASNTINYRTLMLGREGYVSMVMVTNMASIESQKPVAKLMLSSLDFDGGRRYTDFNSSTDRVAEFGLAALVAGVAAKKLGLFALLAVFLAKFAKIGILAGLAFLAAVRRSFGRRKAAVAVDSQGPSGDSSAST